MVSRKITRRECLEVYIKPGEHLDTWYRCGIQHAEVIAPGESAPARVSEISGMELEAPTCVGTEAEYGDGRPIHNSYRGQYSNKW